MTSPVAEPIVSFRLPARYWVAGLVLTVTIAVTYAALFTAEPNLDPADISREIANFIAVVLVAAWARHDIRILNIGFALLMVMLWVEVVDEFTLEPRWVGTGLSAPIGIVGLLMIAVGVRAAANQRRVEVTLRREAEDGLRHSLSTLKAVMENTPDAVWVKDPSGRYVLANAAFTALVGRRPDELIGRSDAELFATDPGAPGRSVARALESGAHERFEETVAVHGTPHTFLVSRNAVRDEEGAAIGILGVARDISDRKVVEERLVHQALHDQLTGLPNRTAFLERLERTLGRRRQARGRPFAVLFVDIDRFKGGIL